MIVQRGCLSGSEAEFGRRDFIKVGSLGFLGIHMGQALRLEAATNGKPGRKAKSCSLVFLEGGPSQMDTWHPKPSSSLRAISPNVPGIQVSELLPNLAKRMDKLALVRSIRSCG